MHAYEVDSEGFIVEVYPLDGDFEILEEWVIRELPQPNFYKPKWDGKEWVEGVNEEELEEIMKPKPGLPSEMDLLKEQVQSQNEAIAELTMLFYGGVSDV